MHAAIPSGSFHGGTMAGDFTADSAVACVAQIVSSTPILTTTFFVRINVKGGIFP